MVEASETKPEHFRRGLNFSYHNYFGFSLRRRQAAHALGLTLSGFGFRIIEKVPLGTVRQLRMKYSLGESIKFELFKK